MDSLKSGVGGIESYPKSIDTTLSARCPHQAMAIVTLFTCLGIILVLAKGGDARQDEQAAAKALIKTNQLSNWA